MTTYVCRKDGTDLTSLVQQTIEGNGVNISRIIPVVEGVAEDPSSDSMGESFLTSAARSQANVHQVLAICPTCGTDNVFNVTIDGL